MRSLVLSPRNIVTLVLIHLCFATQLAAQAIVSAPIPRVDRSGSRPVLIVDNAPYLLLGAQMNNSSAWPATMPQVWEALDMMQANTLEAPIYWESMEPQEGQFNFEQVDMLLHQARDHHRHLVLLWFGTWKNGSSSYAPQWVKQNPKRFPLTQNGNAGSVFSLSPFADETLHADAAAFTALMLHLKQNDPQRTVIMVQVENETGIWGASRDRSKEADQLFHAPVPKTVQVAMGKVVGYGDWPANFGSQAEEYFSAWAIARYIESIVTAGKKVYPLPMYVNAALKDPLHTPAAGSFESGAPSYDLLQLWHAVAPDLDGIEPDIYFPEPEKYQAVLEQYSPAWNAFFVPETGNSTIYAHYFFTSLAHGAFGWSPFGIDTTGYVNYPLGAAKIDHETLTPFALNYKIVAPMERELANWIREGRVYGTAESSTQHATTISFHPQMGATVPWKATVSYGQPAFYSDKPAPGNMQPEGEALIVVLNENEFLVSGSQCRVDFAPLDTDVHGKRMWLKVEEGQYEKGQWRSTRILNGDQTDYGLNFGRQPQVLFVQLVRYE